MGVGVGYKKGKGEWGKELTRVYEKRRTLEISNFILAG